MTKDLDPTSERARMLARKRADELKGFSIHLGVFLIVIAGLAGVDFLSGPGWWFFYPAIAWGIGLAIHGWVVFNDQVFGDEWVERTASGRVPARGKVTTVPAPSSSEVVTQATAMIDRMRGSARNIPNQEVRRQALALSASADQVLAVIEESPDELTLASDFVDRYLTPASSIIGDYARLASRNVPSARATLEKVETHDLPLLSARMDDLYDRLHRGSLIDLEVARDMLRLDMADWDDSELASPTRQDG